MAFPVESIIRGRYLIQSQLGTGNVGDVYLVRDQLITWKSPILFAFKEVINPNRHQLYQITLDGMALRLLQHQALPRVYNVLSSLKADAVLTQPSEPSIATQSQTTLVQNKPPEAIIVPPVPTIQPAPVPEVVLLALEDQEQAEPEIAMSREAIAPLIRKDNVLVTMVFGA